MNNIDINQLKNRLIENIPHSEHFQASLLQLLYSTIPTYGSVIALNSVCVYTYTEFKTYSVKRHEIYGKSYLYQNVIPVYGDLRPGFEKTDFRHYQQLEFRESCFTYYHFQVALLAAWQANWHPHLGDVEIALLAFVPPCGKRLRILRRQQGQSIESISAITGIATVDIRSIEDGLPATAINLIALARCYNVPVGTITGASDRKKIVV